MHGFLKHAAIGLLIKLAILLATCIYGFLLTCALAIKLHTVAKVAIIIIATVSTTTITIASCIPVVIYTDYS